MNACKKCGRMTTRKELFSSFYDHCDFCDAPKKKADAVGDLLMGDGVITLPPGMRFNHNVAFDTHSPHAQYGSPANQVRGWSTRKDTLVYNGSKEIMSVVSGVKGYWTTSLMSGDVLQMNAHSWTCINGGNYEIEFDGTCLIIERKVCGTRWYMDPNKGLIAGSVVGRAVSSGPQIQSIPKTTRVAFAVGSGPCYVDSKDPTTMVHVIGHRPNGVCSCGQTTGSFHMSSGVPARPAHSLKSLSDAVDDAKKKLDEIKKGTP